jgi:hypothetical protein
MTDTLPRPIHLKPAEQTAKCQRRSFMFYRLQIASWLVFMSFGNPRKILRNMFVILGTQILPQKIEGFHKKLYVSTSPYSSATIGHGTITVT